MAAKPLRSIRVADDLWFAAAETATREGTCVSAVVIAALTNFVQRHPAPTASERAQAKRRKRVSELQATDPPPTEDQVDELIRLLRG